MLDQPVINASSKNLPIEKLVTVVKHDNGVYVLSLNRPKFHNALNDALVKELGDIIVELERKDARCFVLTGNAKVFAAGGDISEMQNKTYAEVHAQQYVTSLWNILENRRLPIVAAVNGMALGGGCELALLCDIIVAGFSSTFALPETGLGIIPGAGGTQRLVRAVGKAKAMDMILSGKTMAAIEAERSGLISRIVGDDQVLNEAVYIASNIAKRSKPVIQMAKSAIDCAFETSLYQGRQLEQQKFYATFALKDQKEGMSAFLEKRAAHWQDS